jgi:hypothetical protein
MVEGWKDDGAERRGEASSRGQFAVVMQHSTIPIFQSPGSSRFASIPVVLLGKGGYKIEHGLG